MVKKRMRLLLRIAIDVHILDQKSIHIFWISLVADDFN